MRFELMTLALSAPCSTNWANRPVMGVCLLSMLTKVKRSSVISIIKVNLILGLSTLLSLTYSNWSHNYIKEASYCRIDKSYLCSAYSRIKKAASCLLYERSFDRWLQQEAIVYCFCGVLWFISNSWKCWLKRPRTKMYGNVATVSHISVAKKLCNIMCTIVDEVAS